jgi:high-affinity nickel permease
MAIAATVGGVELVSLLDPRHETTGTFFWASIEAVRDNSAVLGSLVIAVFLIGWVLSAFIVGCRTMFAAPDRVQKQNQA